MAGSVGSASIAGKTQNISNSVKGLKSNATQNVNSVQVSNRVNRVKINASAKGVRNVASGIGKTATQSVNSVVTSGKKDLGNVTIGGSVSGVTNVNENQSVNSVVTNYWDDFF